MNLHVNVARPVPVNRFVDNDLPDEPVQDARVQLLNIGVLSDGFDPAAGILAQAGLICQQVPVPLKTLPQLLLLILRPAHHQVKVLLGDSPGDHVLVELHNHALQGGTAFLILRHLPGQGLRLLTFL